MGMAPMACVLWTQFLKHNPSNSSWPDRDRFVLSAGHASMLLYSLLHLTGYPISLEDIQQFRQWGSKTPGHPEYGHTPGAETTTGPLGQGFSNAVGMAIAEKFLAAHFNRPGYEIVDHRTYVMASDGDMMEGISSEAASLAAHLGLGKLICFYDDNRITIDGDIRLAFSEDVKKRFEAYGWQVSVVEDGDRDLKAIAKAIETAQTEKEKPSLIIVRTHIGYGCPNKAGSSESHGAPLGEEEIKLAKKALGWVSEEPFFIPKEALEHFRKALETGKKSETQWQDSLKKYAAAFPELAREWESWQSGKLPQGWDADLKEFPAGGGNPTRSSWGTVLNAVASKIPNLLGGSSDLTPSNNSYIKGSGDFSKANPAGRNFHFGVREHAMAGITNGMTLHKGLIPYSATFLIFSDYMRPSIRLAAMMGLRNIFVFTHDSVGLGEDGPTHQPVEQLFTLRSVPGLTVIRPADANETLEAWRWTLSHPGGPVAIVLTRQKLPTLAETSYGAAKHVTHGAYILSDCEGRPDLLLLATGSEVSLAIEAQKKLVSRGVKARVVSMPSLEIFEQQSEEYKNKVLPKEITKRLSIEAGITRGWRELVGPQGQCIGLDRFGASAPGEIALKELGFHVDNIVQHALSL